MRVIPLGTSSAVPTSKRGLSAFAIDLESRWLLLDCGEGTQFRLMQSDLKLSRLDGVFITHLHGDHVFGLPGLLSTLGMRDRRSALVVYGPPGIQALIQATLGDPGSRLPYELGVHEIAPSGMVRIHVGEGYSVTCAPLQHRVETYGYRIETPDRPGRFDRERARALGLASGPAYGELIRGREVTLSGGRVVRPIDVLGPIRPGRSVAYCTDTEPCPSAIELARSADLLIHEATYLDELAASAREWKHSTAAEAARIARAAGAKRLLLTHFSARYSDLRPLLHEARSIFAETELAEDLVPLEVALRTVALDPPTNGRAA